MTQQRTTRDNIIKICIVGISAFGLFLCIAVLFPQVRQMIIAAMHKELDMSLGIYKLLQSLAMGGICFTLFLNYCILTVSGKKLTHTVKQEIKDCFSEIDFRSLHKPVLLLFGVYLLGILTIIRANVLYMDDIGRSVDGFREWHNWSRYVSEFASIFIHADTNLTDISPLPQLLAVLMLSISSVLLVYIIGNRKITTVPLLASIPLGLSPYFLECFAFKFDAPYMALSILASIIPFLFVTRKKAFFFCSVIALLIMCMSYQAASGIYLLIAIILCFLDWNSRKKPDKETLSLLGIAAFAFCFAMILFRFFLMKSVSVTNHGYAATSMHPLSGMISGILVNIKNYAMTINSDFGVIWKISIVLICILFVFKSIYTSSRKKIFVFFISILVICLSFIISYGVYYLLPIPVYYPRFLYGFGAFLSILCIYVVLDYKKIAIVAVFVLNWCFLTFAFSYGNALADQERYAEFRIGLLWHDLSSLYPAQHNDTMIRIQLENSIDYAPTIRNISKHYPIIEKLIPKRLGANFYWDFHHFLIHYNNIQYQIVNDTNANFASLDLPVILDSYYHTIKGDENRVLVVLKH